VTCICANSLVLLGHEFDVAHPGRSKLSDGCCASQQHHAQNPFSDHDDGNAGDYTQDPANGMISADWAEQIKDDPRVKYIIRNRQIYNASISRSWRPYTGSNPHDKHGHVSIHPWARDDLRPWLHDDTGDLTVMDKETKAYLDAQFTGITNRQQRARETQLAQGEILRKIAKGEKVTQAELDAIGADIEAIRKELNEEDD
jgi:hypothetical protein